MKINTGHFNYFQSQKPLYINGNQVLIQNLVSYSSVNSTLYSGYLYLYPLYFSRKILLKKIYGYLNENSNLNLRYMIFTSRFKENRFQPHLRIYNNFVISKNEFIYNANILLNEKVYYEGIVANNYFKGFRCFMSNYLLNNIYDTGAYYFSSYNNESNIYDKTLYIEQNCSKPRFYYEVEFL